MPSQSRDHRVHHKKSDGEGDPYNASRGFFYSHVGWLLLKKPQAVLDAGKQLNFDDLLAVSSSTPASRPCMFGGFCSWTLGTAESICHMFSGPLRALPTQPRSLVEPVLVLLGPVYLRLLQVQRFLDRIFRAW